MWRPSLRRETDTDLGTGYRPAQARGLRPLAAQRELPALSLLLIAVIGVYTVNPAFRTPDNLAVLAQDAGILGILACGQALVILTAGIDLSVASTLALSACAAGALMMNGMSWLAASAVGVCLGGMAGGFNGFLVTYRKLPPILVTLSTLLLYRGITNVATGAAPFNLLPDPFKAIGKGVVPLTVMAVLGGVLALTMARGRLGRHVMAVGGSRTAAMLSGVPPEPVLRRTYMISGLCAGIAGMLLAAANGNAQWNLADGWELDVIAATVIGGVRLTGGEGSVVGAMLGAMIIVVLRNAMFLFGVPVEQYGLVTGGVIVLAAFAEQWRRRAEVPA